MAQITLINPTISLVWNDEMRFLSGKPDTQIQVVSLELGTASIETRLDDDLATPGIIEQTILAQDNGADAVVINCMDDPGLYAAREVVRIPVVGPAEASMHLAAMLSHRFSLITTGYTDILVVEELILRYRMSAKAAPVRALGIPVLDLDAAPERTIQKFVERAEAAVKEDGAGAIIPGCNLLANMVGKIQDGLAQRGIMVPVLNPILVAIRLAETLIALGLSQSQRSYPSPANKPIQWYVPSSPILSQTDRKV